MESTYYNEQPKEFLELDLQALEELKSLTFKPILAIKDMEENNPYKILSTKKLTTRFGERLLLELENYQLYLPARFTHISEKTIHRINEGGFCITNRGTNGRYHNIMFSKGTEGETPYFYF